MQTWEHGMLTANSASSELTFHTAGGATVMSDGIGPRHTMAALDTLSENGWELTGPPTTVQTGNLMASSYHLRRTKPAGDPPVH